MQQTNPCSWSSPPQLAGSIPCFTCFAHLPDQNECLLVSGGCISVNRILAVFDFYCMLIHLIVAKTMGSDQNYFSDACDKILATYIRWEILVYMWRASVRDQDCLHTLLGCACAVIHNWTFLCWENNQVAIIIIQCQCSIQRCVDSVHRPIQGESFPTNSPNLNKSGSLTYSFQRGLCRKMPTGLGSLFILFCCWYSSSFELSFLLPAPTTPKWTNLTFHLKPNKEVLVFCAIPVSFWNISFAVQ